MASLAAPGQTFAKQRYILLPLRRVASDVALASTAADCIRCSTRHRVCPFRVEVAASTSKWRMIWRRPRSVGVSCTHPAPRRCPARDPSTTQSTGTAPDPFVGAVQANADSRDVASPLPSSLPTAPKHQDPPKPPTQHGQQRVDPSRPTWRPPGQPQQARQEDLDETVCVPSSGRWHHPE
jgi:hypothetical protein